jgi:hypothetical protein
MDYGTAQMTNAWTNASNGYSYDYSQIGESWSLYNVTMYGQQGTDSSTGDPQPTGFGFNWSDYN